MDWLIIKNCPPQFLRNSTLKNIYIILRKVNGFSKSTFSELF